MPDRRTAIVDLAAATLRQRDRLLVVSEPGAWPAPAMLFGLAAYEADRGISAALIVGVLYFTLPFGLLRHGLDEVDPDGTTRAAIAVTNLPLLAALVLLGGAATGMAALLTVAVAVADVLPPLRLRDRPGLDLLAGGALLALPAACGLALGRGAPAGVPPMDHPWSAIVAIVAWGAASAALEAVRDGRSAGTRPIVGDRILAGLATIGYVAAAAIAVTVAGPGWLAGAGLLAFVLLPLAVLAAPAIEAVGRARVAMADLHGLVWLVGAWLVVLLVVRWSALALVPWAVAIAAPTVVLGYALANVVTTRIATRRLRAPDGGPDDGVDDTLTIVAPADDGSIDLGATLRSVRAQTYPGTTIVAVATSDAAAQEAAGWLGDDLVRRVPPAPIGPAGTAWSWHAGVRAADTDVVLLLDPGVALAPIGARVLVEQRARRDVDLLIGLGRDEMMSAVERRTTPGFAMWHAGFRPIWWAALTGGRPAALATDAGPLLLVRRDAYLGLEDDATRVATGAEPSLEHAFARAGRSVGIVWLGDLASVRRDGSARAVIDTWRRSVALGGGALAGALVTVLIQLVAYAVPLVLPIVALLTGTGAALFGAACLPLVALLVVRIALALTQRQPLATLVWHPVTIAITLAGLLGGIVDHVRGHRQPAMPWRHGTPVPPGS